ncbi:MAG: hypothetical protein IJW23_09800, partial [Lentisphaeria bacterium]|nr:hypothetical protein [Lentisphaeria bacterium]
GDYVYILGDDDLLLPEFVADVQNALDSGAELVHATAQLIDSDGNVTKTETIPSEVPYEVETKRFLTDYIRENAYHISLGSLVFPLKAFREIGAFKSMVMNALSMDILFNVEMFSVISKITVLAKPVWQYRFGVADWCGALKCNEDILRLYRQYFELSNYARKYFTGELVPLYEMFHRKQILSSIVRFCWMKSPFRTFLLCFKSGLRFKERYLMFRDILYMMRQ